MEQLCIFPGMLLIAVVLHDVFQTVIVPRKADTIFRITPVLIVFFLWPLFKLLSTKGEDNQQSESVLNIFAPLAVIVLLLAWVSLLIVGYGAILYGLRAGIRPQIDSFGTALYFAGTCLFTLGFGEFDIFTFFSAQLFSAPRSPRPSIDRSGRCSAFRGDFS
jgi:succinate dehydrogenase/fumarate reductase cytochrome b subunit